MMESHDDMCVHAIEFNLDSLTFDIEYPVYLRQCEISEETYEATIERCNQLMQAKLSSIQKHKRLFLYMLVITPLVSLLVALLSLIFFFAVSERFVWLIGVVLLVISAATCAAGSWLVMRSRGKMMKIHAELRNELQMVLHEETTTNYSFNHIELELTGYNSYGFGQFTVPYFSQILRASFRPPCIQVITNDPQET